MNPKPHNEKQESKLVRFSELSKGYPKPTPFDTRRLAKDSRVIGIEDQSKNRLAKKIIEKGKSY